jgi:hypothetical protein
VIGRQFAIDDLAENALSQQRSPPLGHQAMSGGLTSNLECVEVRTPHALAPFKQRQIGKSKRTSP